MFEFKYAISDADYIEFNIYHLLNSSVSRGYSRFLRWSVPLISAMMLVPFLSVTNDAGLSLLILLLTVMSAVWVISYKKIMSSSVKLYIERIKKTGKPPYGSDIILKFTDEYIILITEDEETKTRYKKIEKIVIANNAVYVYVNVLAAYIIPRRAFTGPAQQHEFLYFLENKANHLIRLPAANIR